MKINQAITAIECFHSLPTSHFSREEKIVMSCLHNCQTISLLRQSTGIEKSSLSRVLNGLHHEKKLIEVYKTDVCPVSKKRVQYYRVANKQLKLF